MLEIGYIPRLESPTEARTRWRSSVDGTFFGVSLRELLRVFHKPFAVSCVLLCEVVPKWMIGFGFVHERDQGVDDLIRIIDDSLVNVYRL